MKLFVLCLFLALMMPIVTFAYDNECTHPVLASLAVEQYNSAAEHKITKEELYWIAEGARIEDKPEWRSLNHFYDPVSGQGLNMAGVPLGNDSLSWALSTQSSLVYTQDQSWPKAVEMWRQKRRKEAMLALGGALHLLADAGLPAHVRNDEHLEGDPYESWIKENSCSGKLNWDWPRHDLKKCSTYARCIENLAWWTNQNFVSRDTASDFWYLEPVRSSKLATDGFVYANGHIIGKSSVWGLELDSAVHSAYWQELAPEIVAYGATVLRDFFAEVDRNEDEAKQSRKKSLRLAGGEKIYVQPLANLTIDRAKVSLAGLSFTNEKSGLGQIVRPAESPKIVVLNSSGGGGGQSTSNELVTSTIASTSTVSSTDSNNGLDTSSTSSTIAVPTSTLYYASSSIGLINLVHFGQYAVSTSQEYALDSMTGNYVYSAGWSTSSGRWGDAGVLVPQPTYPLAWNLADNLQDKDFTLAGYLRLGGSSRLALVQGDMSVDFGVIFGLDVSTLIYDDIEERLAMTWPNDNNWHQFALVASSSSLQIYIDAELAETAMANYHLPNGSWRYLWKGLAGDSAVDELAVWNRALNETEIRAWYESGLELGK